MAFVADNVFHIEKSALYGKLASKGVKSVEFVGVQDDKLLFVEARTTLPKPGDDPSAENPLRFQEEINDICDKFIHSIQLFSSVKIAVNEATLPCDFAMPEKVSLSFILVVKELGAKSCRRTEETLKANLPSYFKKIWRPRVRVLNHEDAVGQGIAHPVAQISDNVADA